jgi:hypothetical protein
MNKRALLDYSFIRPTLQAFVRAKLAKPTSGEVALDSPVERKGLALLREPEYGALFDELGLDIWTFGEAFINSWQALTPSQIQRVVAVWNEVHGPAKHLHLEVQPFQQFQALQWTVAQVIDLVPEVELLPPVWDLCKWQGKSDPLRRSKNDPLANLVVKNEKKRL